MLRPFQKSHNTAFRLLTVLQYGIESGKPFLEQLWVDGRYLRLRLRSGSAAYSMRMTIPRMREHLEWLEAIGLLSDLSRPSEGVIELTLKLPVAKE